MAPLEVDVDVGVGSSSSSDGLKVAGKNHASNADPDDDTGSEMIVPSEAGGMAMSSVEVSMSGFVNYVRTETDAAPESDQKVPVDYGDQGKRKVAKEVALPLNLPRVARKQAGRCHLGLFRRRDKVEEVVKPRAVTMLPPNSYGGNETSAMSTWGLWLTTRVMQKALVMTSRRMRMT